MSVQYLYVAQRNNKGSKFIYGVSNTTHVILYNRIFEKDTLKINNKVPCSFIKRSSSSGF